MVYFVVIVAVSASWYGLRRRRASRPTTRTAPAGGIGTAVATATSIETVTETATRTAPRAAD
jgi:hypothetical protein